MYSNILVPVASGEAELCDAPLKIAASLAAPDAKITLVHLFESLPGYVAQQVPAEVLNSNRKEVLNGIEAAAAKIDGARVVLLDGSPGRTISEYAAQEAMDLVVMASHRPGMGDILWGSTAGFVVRHVPCAVHVLR